MPRFPKREAEIEALAINIAMGLWANPMFPDPPVPIMTLVFKIHDYRDAKNTVIVTKAAAEQTATAKDEALEDLVEAVKANIRYAENTVNYDDNKLKLIGWAGRKKGSVLQPPGQARRRLDVSKAKEYFGFEAKTSFDEGLKATIDWYMASREGM